MKKRVIGYALMSAAILGLLGACGSKKAADDSGDKDRELTVWTNVLKPSQTVASWKESPFHTGLAKASGIDVDWQFPAEGTDGTQAFNLLLSDEKLPDIIGYNVRDDAESYIKDGVIQDLTDILKEKAPNYYQYLQDNPDLAKSVTTDSGKIYAFGVFRETDAQGAFYGPEIRKDWLDEAGLAVPTNPDEWENALKVMNEKHGGKFAFAPTDMDLGGFSGGFGAHGTFGLNFYVGEDGKVAATQTQEEWKNYMEWLHKLYAEGLIDPDVATIDDEGLKTKAANDKLSATYNLGSRTTIYEDQSKANGKTSDWVWAPYPKQADGSDTSYIFSSGRVQNFTWVVTTSAKGAMLDKAMKWLDYAYSPEGKNYWNFGEKGVSWEEKDGKPVYTDKVIKNELGASEAKVLYTGLSNTGLGEQLLDSLATTEDGIKPDEVAGNTWAKDADKALASIYPSSVTMTEDEAKEAATIMNTLNTYCSENAMKFMTGDRPVSDYDKFVKELKDQGLERLTEIKQAAYDRYLKR